MVLNVIFILFSQGVYFGIFFKFYFLFVSFMHNCYAENWIVNRLNIAKGRGHLDGNSEKSRIFIYGSNITLKQLSVLKFFMFTPINII